MEFANDVDPAAEYFLQEPPPHLATENMIARNSAPRQQESSPATKRVRMGGTPQRRTLEEKSNYEGHSGNAAHESGDLTTTATTTNTNTTTHATTTTAAAAAAAAAASTTATTRSVIENNTRSTNGDGSVTLRRELLDEFGKQNKHHYEKAAHIGRHPDGVVLTKPVRPKCQAAPHPTIQQRTVPSNTTGAAKLVKKPPSTDQHPHHPTQHHHHHHHHHGHHAAYRGPELTPVRIKPRFKKEDVEATNNGYAPVAKLAAWLADNPTSNKKVACVRKGANVIAKSRKFERDLENVIIEETGIEAGAVADKKQRLQSALSDDVSETSGSLVNVSDKRKWLAHAFKRGDDEDEDHMVAAETASEILSVTDKKKWLESAFKKGADGKMTKVAKATSMVNMPRGNDDATTRAKKKWQENSARRLAAREAQGRRSTTQNEQPVRSSLGEASVVAEQHRPARKSHDHELSGPRQLDRREIFAARGGSKEVDSEDMVWEAEHKDNEGFATRSTVEEDKTPVDFRAARELLIQRSKQNGNPLTVVSKVQRRKQIFEKFEKEHKRRSGQYGLLRPSWEPLAESNEGPSTAYKKTFVEDIVPKKSFEELP